VQQARKISKANQPVKPIQPAREHVPGAQQARRLKKIKLLAIALGCFVLGLALIAQYSSLVILNYQLSAARSELAETRASVQALELEAARLGSISRIDEIAREELGMVEPEKDQLRIISSSQREGYRPGE